MQASLFLAKLIGPTLLVIGLGLLINRDGYRAMTREFLASRALIYLAGVLAFVPGLALVLVHNIWVGDWRVIITLLGWISTLAGIFRLVFPQEVTRLGNRILSQPNALLVSGAVFAALGAILCFYGFLR